MVVCTEVVFECFLLRGEGVEVGGEEDVDLIEGVVVTLGYGAFPCAEVFEPTVDTEAMPVEWTAEVCFVKLTDFLGYYFEKRVLVDAFVASDVSIEGAELVFVEVVGLGGNTIAYSVDKIEGAYNGKCISAGKGVDDCFYATYPFFCYHPYGGFFSVE